MSILCLTVVVLPPCGQNSINAGFIRCFHVVMREPERKDGETDTLSYLMLALHPADPDVILVRLPCSFLYIKKHAHTCTAG